MKHSALILLLCTLSAVGCRNRTFENPVDAEVPLAAPSELKITGTAETVFTLSWKLAGTDPVYSSVPVRIVIERSTGGAEFSAIDTAVAGVTTRAVAGLYQPGTAYSFRVRVVADRNASAPSNIATDSIVFGAPADCAVTSFSASAAGLSWTDRSTFETGFLVFRSTDGLNYAVVDSTAANVTSRSIAGPYQRYVTYWFKVCARTARSISGFSNDAKGSVPVGDTTMIRVEGGTFQMGTTGGMSNEKPVHTVTVSAFSMDKFEITYALWTEVRTWGLAHGYTDLAPGQNGSNPVGQNNPVTAVNWYDVVKWCNARSEKDGLAPVYYTSSAKTAVYRTGDIDIAADAVQWMGDGYRLPTEAEWEFAARGGTKTKNYIYSGGALADVAWYYTNSGNSTHQVGTRLANELGLFDMSGNVAERCWDWYESYTTDAQSDPAGPATGSYRVLRGGTFNNSNDVGIDCRVTARDNSGANIRAANAGFRCVHD